MKDAQHASPHRNSSVSSNSAEQQPSVLLSQIKAEGKAHYRRAKRAGDTRPLAHFHDAAAVRHGFKNLKDAQDALAGQEASRQRLGEEGRKAVRSIIRKGGAGKWSVIATLEGDRLTVDIHRSDGLPLHETERRQQPLIVDGQMVAFYWEGMFATDKPLSPYIGITDHHDSGPLDDKGDPTDAPRPGARLAFDEWTVGISDVSDNQVMLRICRSYLDRGPVVSLPAPTPAGIRLEARTAIAETHRVSVPGWTVAVLRLHHPALAHETVVAAIALGDTDPAHAETAARPYRRVLKTAGWTLRLRGDGRAPYADDDCNLLDIPPLTLHLRPEGGKTVDFHAYEEDDPEFRGGALVAPSGRSAVWRALPYVDHDLDIEDTILFNLEPLGPGGPHGSRAQEWPAGA